MFLLACVIRNQTTKRTNSTAVNERSKPSEKKKTSQGSRFAIFSSASRGKKCDCKNERGGFSEHNAAREEEEEEEEAQKEEEEDETKKEEEKK